MDIEIPYGYCHCGCGGKTRLAEQNCATFGWKKGEPKRYIRGHSGPNRYRSLETFRQRFYNSFIPVTESGCWLWEKSTLPQGYGQLIFQGEKKAHRVSWVLHRGPIPEGMYVLHKCDVPFCVNPDHLFLGTIQDNSDDMLAKGRNTRGEAVHTAKLKECDVIAIRGIGRSVSLTEMGKRYGVTKQAIAAILNGKSWKYLK